MLIPRELARTRAACAGPLVRMVEPILLGGGKRLFPSDGRARPLELVSTTTAGTGVLICTYRPVGG
jgi:hypothetical protein